MDTRCDGALLFALARPQVSARPAQRSSVKRSPSRSARAKSTRCKASAPLCRQSRGSALRAQERAATNDWRVVCGRLARVGKQPDAGLQKRSRDRLEPLENGAEESTQASRLQDRKEAALALLEKARSDDRLRQRARDARSCRRREDSSATRRRPTSSAAHRQGREDIRDGRRGLRRRSSPRRSRSPPLMRSRRPDLRRRAARSRASASTSPQPRARAGEIVENGDNGPRAGPRSSARKQPLEADMPALEPDWKRASGEIAAELTYGVQQNAAKIPGRERAARAGGTARRRSRAVTHVPTLEKYASNPPRRNRDQAREDALRALPRPEDAGARVHNFLELARRRLLQGNALPPRYDDELVIQREADYRGRTRKRRRWERGAAGRSSRPSVARGALGMPRNDDPDSGGSQTSSRSEGI